MLRVILLALTLTLTSCATDPVARGMYRYQLGDYDVAEVWFRIAAKQGNAGAQHNLGVMYENGQGVPQDDAEAVKWYRMAAEQGYDKPQNNLGQMYRNGLGVPQDDAEAVKWYRKAAEQGLAEAQFNLGNMYSKGEGVPQDDVLAYMWFNLAVAQGIDVAKANRDDVATRMTSEQIAEAQRLAREWKPK